MNNSLNELINSSKSLLILLPTNPTLDQVAAGLSLYLATNRSDVVISCPSPMIVEFNRLVGVDKITSQLGNKNLSITFADYPADNLKEVSYDVVDGEIKLTVIPKPTFEAPKKDQVILSYSGVSADTIIMIGGANDNHFPVLKSKDLEQARLAHIGTRNLNLGRDFISFDVPSSSVSEIIATFLKESGREINPDLATNLLIGIEDATRGFSENTVTAETFATVSLLMSSGGRRYVPSQEPRQDQFPAGSIPGLPVGRPFNRPQFGSSQAPVPKSWLEPKVYKGTNVS